MPRLKRLIILLVLGKAFIVFAQLPRLESIVMVTDDQDSIVRSFTRQGFTVQPLVRDPVGLFRDQVVLPNTSSVIFESPRTKHDWRYDALINFGRPFVSELRFYAADLDSLRRQIEADSIAVVLVDSTNPSLGFSIDSTAPLVLSFTSDTVAQTFIPHERAYYRIDWVILGASQDVEAKLRRLFEAIGFPKAHRGCCDFWRTGSPRDFTFVRFETPQPPWRGETNWLSIGKNALFFAYH